MTTYRYHVKRRNIGQPIRLIITPHIQWNSSVPERSLQLASLLQLGFDVRNRCIPCAIDNKKGLSTSKLVSSPLLLSAPLIYVRAVPCPDLRSVHTRCRALCSFIKKHRNSSKLDSCVLYSFAHCACSSRLLWLLADVCEDTTIYIEDVSVNCI